MANPTFDLHAAHRWFAIEANNLAWSLVELATRTADEAERMLDAAHAARHHWFVVGTPLHQLRAEILLATAHALAQSDHAARHAERAIRLAASESITAFDRASLHGSASMALAAIGNASAAAHQRDLYRAACATVEAEDLSLLSSIYGDAGDDPVTTLAQA